MNKHLKVDTEAKNAILNQKGKMSLRAFANSIDQNAGYLSAVISGKRVASNKLRLSLGLPPRTVSVTPLRCGHAPVSKRCPICRPSSTTPNAQRKRDRRLEAMRSAVRILQANESMSG